MENNPNKMSHKESHHSIVSQERVERFNEYQKKMGIPRQTILEVQIHSTKKDDLIDACSLQEMADFQRPHSTVKREEREGSCTSLNYD